jgi:coniferyl-aldehyde dehydrogenase
MAQLHQVMQLAPAVADQRMRDVLDRQRAAFNREGYVSAEVRIDRLTRLLALTVEHQDLIVDTMRADFGGERSREATLLSEFLPTVQGSSRPGRHCGAGCGRSAAGSMFPSGCSAAAPRSSRRRRAWSASSRPGTCPSV